jgi:hypothetical protein
MKEFVSETLNDGKFEKKAFEGLVGTIAYYFTIPAYVELKMKIFSKICQNQS